MSLCEQRQSYAIDSCTRHSGWEYFIRFSTARMPTCTSQPHRSQGIDLHHRFCQEEEKFNRLWKPKTRRIFEAKNVIFFDTRPDSHKTSLKIPSATTLFLVRRCSQHCRFILQHPHEIIARESLAQEKPL